MTDPAQVVADYLKQNLPDVAVYLAKAPEPEDVPRTVVRIGETTVGTAVAVEILENGRIVYEVEPKPGWSGFAPHPRRAIES